MPALQKVVDGKNLTREEAEAAMEAIVGGAWTDAKAAAFLTALRMKGETPEELAAFARAMRKSAVQIHPKREALVDTCGTGGDASLTFNVSTAAALVAAGAGAAVAKHGNRSVSGRCGSADVLERLGVRMLSPPEVERCIEETGFGFLFAPLFHPAMKRVAPLRRDLGIRTVFNVLGPLTNPANVERQVLGTFHPRLTEDLAHVLDLLGTTHAFVVHAQGMDEIGLGKTQVSELKGGTVRTYTLDAASLGFCEAEIPKAASREEAAKILMGVLQGEEGPARDVTLLNAAAALYVAGKSPSIEGGLTVAEEALDSGRAREKLDEIVRFPGG